MKSKNKTSTRSQGRTLLIALFVVLAVLILLLRMMVFVAGHGRHHF
jgi:hypothetical protein